MRTIAASILGPALSFVALLPAPSAQAAEEPFIAEIMYTAADFCPRGWAVAHGALLPITQNVALFSLLGTRYGGDGRTTFALPKLKNQLLAINPKTRKADLSLLPCIATEGIYPSRE